MSTTFGLKHDENQALCASLGGILPEPRDELENDFLDSLDPEQFTLGMTDRVAEGIWVWDSDGSLVTWTYWIKWDNGWDHEPNGAEQKNCAKVTRNKNREEQGWVKKGWATINCGVPYNERRKSLVCQRNATNHGKFVWFFCTATTLD